MNAKSSKKRLREILLAARKQKLTKGLTPVKIRLLFEELGPDLREIRSDSVNAF